MNPSFAEQVAESIAAMMRRSGARSGKRPA